MMRSNALVVLKGASSQFQEAIRGSGGGKACISEGVEAFVIYVRFKVATSELKPLLEEIESRSSRKEYGQILAECHRLYCEQCLSLSSKLSVIDFLATDINNIVIFSFRF
ncbi:hypothetical protein GmHk_09G025951 [Glycine max]|nr:hypothetical protein GmHk_09G025951 [Glycine max]